MDLIKIAEDAFKTETKERPSFGAGDTISISYKIKEGNKERIQIFKGVVIQIKGAGSAKMMTVRKMSGNQGVERIFPLNSPFIESIEVNRYGKVRRKRIYYLRGLTGKKARIKERRM
ncbi:50S ribosomal protein L19 [Saccharicrinis fermentans]|uniref:Large ribosomal subunit protein bL19 n=1 Tax=Saccharicrinis fermentans DSM 9555 = JCM 21142 TaxID=869213 RepID=W7YG93_9BACT|nr:50S ribosomal protein L19 [Saccharicrinis fermentans]GAF03466.1 50S ribosomal protein L19 [Saccharicrinis fermentans DSM 9555 = JCM 21142]